MITPSEARALRTAVGFMNAGEADGVPQHECEAAEAAASRLAEAPARAVWLPFSQMEMRVLWEAVTNGAEGVLQPSSGMRPDQKAAFRAAANRLADAAGVGPRF